MQDLNDFYYFDQVITHGGFAAAGRAINTPKSKLSRRISQLEARLGARLIERSSRRFRITEIGRAFHDQCRIALDAATRAETLVASALSEPRGLVRFACPTGMIQNISPLLSDFLKIYPKGRIQMVAVDRPVDLIKENIDVALRVRVSLDTDASLIMRTIGHSRRFLVASPSLANRLASQDIKALETLPTLASSDDNTEITWKLEGKGGEIYSHTHLPKFGCSDFSAVCAAAIAGLGVAFLPDHLCTTELRSGALVRLWPEWHGEDGIVHLVFTAKTGLPPLVRAWINHLSKHFSAMAP